MIKDLDTSELEKLKGIGIGMTHDEQPFLIVTYQKKMMREEALTWVYWLVIAALLSVTGLVFWWAVQ